jgi:hypothetical protein
MLFLDQPSERATPVSLSPALLRNVATIVVGALPATLLCLLPGMIIGGYIAEVLAALWGDPLDDDLLTGPSLLMLAWCGAAIYGTVCLWLITFTGRRPAVLAGLLAGLAAIAPYFYVMYVDANGAQWGPVLLVAGPTLTALAWIGFPAIAGALKNNRNAPG